MIGVEQKFWSFVNKTSTCWLWNGSKTKGYGDFRFRGLRVYAHRYAYELLVGPISKGLELDHLCRNPACIRPDHLDPVSHAVNMSRGVQAMKTHCIAGHPYSGENLIVRPTSKGGMGRHCRACKRANEKRRYYENKRISKKSSE